MTDVIQFLRRITMHTVRFLRAHARTGVALMILPGLIWGAFVVFQPAQVEAAPTVVFITDTATTTWKVPVDWNSASNTVEVIGGGGSGSSLSTGGGGGGGGAYAKVSNLTFTPGTNVTVKVGAGGTAGNGGGNTWFNAASFAACISAAVCVSAAGGAGAGTGATGAIGGTTTAGVGTIEFAGGTGGSGDSAGDDSTGGGGGAGSPNGTGGTGGSGDGTNPGEEAHGGGGASGDDTGTSDNGSPGTSDGGAGGDSNGNASSGGTGGVSGNGNPGTDGGGGGGGDGTNGSNYSGGVGGDGEDWQVSPARGAGGGGGGGDDDGGTGGNGGLYGGGGGGGATPGTGAQGIIVITYTPPDVTVPTPNPPSFSTVPINTSASAMTMTSVTVTDTESSPVQYYFAATSSSCASGHEGTGASNSDWQSSATYAPTGLQANKCYGWAVTARDSATPAPNLTATSTASTTYTSAATPGALTFSNVSTTTFTIINAENGNPAANPTTDFKVYATSSGDANWHQKYVDASGDPTATVTWLTDAQIDSLTVRGLDDNVLYDFVVVARNADGDLTSSSTLAGTTTIDGTSPTPNPPYFSTLPINDAADQISMLSVTGSDASSVNYYFATTTSFCTAGHEGTGATDSGWQVGASYIDTGLQANKCYSYTITLRDTSPIRNFTATSTASSTYSSAAIPGALTFGSVSTSTFTITNAENGNPASNPTTDFKVFATSSDATWNNRYVDASGDPSASIVWLTDAQIDNLTVRGLDENTEYRFVVVARNADGDLTASSSQSAVTTLDETSPTPDPMTFDAAPNDASDTSISMDATVATDASSPPVAYYFSHHACAANGGTGGTDSGWQGGVSYTDSGLQPNQCYGYRVAARDSASAQNTTASSSQSDAYTAAAVPGAPTFGSIGSSTATFTNVENGNPSANPTTYFAVQASSTVDAGWNTYFLNGSGSTSSAEVWLTDAELDAVTITNLQELTSYQFRVKARNESLEETSYGSYGTLDTIDADGPTPDPMTFDAAPNDASDTSISMIGTTAVDSGTPPSLYYFGYFACAGGNSGTGGTDSGWQGSSSYTDSGLQANKCYGYKVQARDSATPPNHTASSSQSEAYTAAAIPSAPTLSDATKFTFILTNNENGNPSANPTTSFVAQVSTTDGTWNGKYIDALGSPSVTEVWLTDAALDGLTVGDLTTATEYQVRIKARNQSSEETSYSSYASVTTNDPDPKTIRVNGGTRLGGIRLW